MLIGLRVFVPCQFDWAVLGFRFCFVFVIAAILASR